MTQSKDRKTNPTPTQTSPQESILNLALGYLASRGLHVATELGIADRLKDGPKSIEELARATGAHTQSLYRLLRMLAGYGVFAEETVGQFRLTPLGAVLQIGVAGSVHDAVRMIGDLGLGGLRSATCAIACSRENRDSITCTEWASSTTWLGIPRQVPGLIGDSQTLQRQRTSPSSVVMISDSVAGSLTSAGDREAFSRRR